MRSIRKTEGFTLIELMIVVAIIGILAAIAIPNFLKFQCKSKQSEAKTNLSGVFTAEKAFFGEYNTYGSDLVSVNWIPDGTPLYIYGTDTSYPADVAGISTWAEDQKDTMVASVIGSPARYSTAKMLKLNGSALAAADIPSATDVTGQIFTFGAAGDIDTESSGVSLDTWTINNTKQLSVSANDCTS